MATSERCRAAQSYRYSLLGYSLFPHFRQRSWSQNHCSGCSRTQPSTTPWSSTAVGAVDVDQALGVARHVDRRRHLHAEAAVGQADGAARHAPGIELAGEQPDERVGAAPAGRRTGGWSSPIAAGRSSCRGARRASIARRRSRRPRRGRRRPAVPIEVAAALHLGSDVGVGRRRGKGSTGRPKLGRPTAAESSQLARWAPKIIAGLPPSRSAIEVVQADMLDRSAGRSRCAGRRRRRSPRGRRIRPLARARLSQTPDRMARRSAALFSGKAAARFRPRARARLTKGPNSRDRRRSRNAPRRAGRSRPSRLEQEMRQPGDDALPKPCAPAGRSECAFRRFGREHRRLRPRLRPLLGGRAAGCGFASACFGLVVHSVTMILPKTLRDSRRASAASISSSAIIESITGPAMPSAILASESARLRMVQPKLPIRRSCRW